MNEFVQSTPGEPPRGPRAAARIGAMAADGFMQAHLLAALGLLVAAGVILYGFYVEQRVGHRDRLFWLAVEEQRHLVSALLEFGSRRTNSGTGRYNEDDQARLQGLARRGAAGAERLERLSASKPSSASSGASGRASERALDERWKRVKSTVPVAARSSPDRLGLSAQSGRVLVRLNRVLVNADEVVKRLLATDSRLAQVHAATRQLMLIERIKTAVRQIADGGSEGLGAADRAGRDAVLLGEINNALLVGSPQLRLERVTNQDVRSHLQRVGRAFRALATEMEALIARAAELREATPRLPVVDFSAFVAACSGVRAEIAKAESRAEAARAQRMMTLDNLGWASAGWMVLLSLFLARLWAGRRRVRSLALQREARIEVLEGKARALTERQRDFEQQSQSRDERRAELLWRFVDGDYSAPNGGEDLDEQFLSAAQALASRLSLGLSDVKDVAGKMNGATGLLSEAASNLASLGGDSLRGLRAARSASDMLNENLKSMSGEVQSLAALEGSGGEVISRGVESLDTLEHQLAACTDAVAEAGRTIRLVIDAADGLRELFSLTDDLNDRARILALNMNLRADDTAGPVADELSRFADRVTELSRIVSAVKTAIETDTETAQRAAQQAVAVLEQAGSRAQRVHGAAHEMLAHSHRTRSRLDSFANTCREQLTELRRQSHALSELAARAEQGCTGAARLGAAAARLGELSMALERRSLQLLSGAAQAGTVVHLSMAASPPQSEDTADSVAGILSRAEEIPADARRVARDDPPRE